MNANWNLKKQAEIAQQSFERREGWMKSLSYFGGRDPATTSVTSTRMTPTTIIIDTPAKRDRAVKWLARVPVDEVMELSLRPYKPTRSQTQSARYWAIVTKVAEHTGHDKDELHEMFKARYLGTQTTELEGETITHQRSSSRLKVKEFAEYMEQVEAWMVSTLGIWLE